MLPTAQSPPAGVGTIPDRASGALFRAGKMKLTCAEARDILGVEVSMRTAIGKPAVAAVQLGRRPNWSGHLASLRRPGAHRVVDPSR